MKEKIQTASLSVLSNTLLITMKLIVGIISKSVSILSEAIHSSLDLIAAIIAFFSVRISDNPPDKVHPYGHGKIENISGVVEGILILVAAGWIITEAAKRLSHPGELEALGWGTAVMAVSAIVNLFVSRQLYKTAKKTDSIALEADALHLKTDVYTSVGVCAGLLLMWITKLYWLDPIIAIAVALLIIKESVVLMKNAFAPLVDTSLSDEEVSVIREIVKKHSLQLHSLKTRKSGSYRFADFHLEMQGTVPLETAHLTCDIIENEIKEQIRNIELTIHVEPV